jgi:tetraacyldisaccharide 4'-kinase
VNPLVALYSGVVCARNRLYDLGTLKVHRLEGPVASIGNIAVGGSGKTPFLIALGELLKQRGIPFDVLSRGYGRATKGVHLVDLEGSPREFGDEPLLIARKLNAPVVVAEDRYAAGRFAEQQFGPQLHLLDDGFQHRRLARDCDIVLVTPTDAENALLPVGRLREPLSSLARADVLVLTNNAPGEKLPLDGKQVWRVERGIVPPPLAGPCVAFCGIARPQNFFTELSAAGVTLAATKSFPDHHVYKKFDVRKLLELGRRCGAAGFITTEKDEINLGPLRAELSPLHVVPVQMKLLGAETAVDLLLEELARRPRPA